MNISIIYLTSRNQSMVEWFCDSLANQLAGCKHDIDVVFVDTRLWYEGEERRKYFKQSVNGRFPFTHIPPKDTVWQGPRRLTKEDYFCASSARNTGCMYARGDYLLFVDDLSVLFQSWLSNACHAAENRYVVCGAYKKVKKLFVKNGVIVQFENFPQGQDSRWNRGSDSGIVNWKGSALFGCSFGCPTEGYLTVNGFDELLDGQGGEDYDFGIRIERAGYKVFYNRNMTTFESEELHSQLPVMKRIIKKQEGRHDASVICLQRVCNESRVWTMQSYYNLRQERDKVLSGGIPTFVEAPIHHWYDGQPLSEM